jgi:hypothetical protein
MLEFFDRQEQRGNIISSLYDDDGVMFAVRVQESLLKFLHRQMKHGTGGKESIRG